MLSEHSIAQARWPRQSGLLFGLALSGVMLAAIFYFGFTQPYSLAEFGDRQRQSIGTLSDFSKDAGLLFIVTMLALFVLYALGYWLTSQTVARWQQVNRGAWLALIVLGGVVLTLVLLPMYPADASDVYDYIIRGRMSAIYGLNPMDDVPIQIRQDPIYRFASWKQTPSAYGPLWEMIAHTASSLTADATPNQQVYAYKLINVAGYALSALGVWLTLRVVAPRRQVLGLFLWSWNPLVLYMTAGTAHHDALMSATIVFAVFALVKRWYVAATVIATIGFLIKLVPALLVPVIALVALRELGFRRWLRYALWCALLCGGLIVVTYAPYWHGFDTLRTSRRAFMYTGSVAAVARRVLVPILDGVTTPEPLSRQTPLTNGFLANLTLVLFGLYYVVELSVIWLRREPLEPVRALARIIGVYLLLATLWFHAWYVLWWLVLVALLEDTPTRRLALVFSYWVTWQSFLYTFFNLQTKTGVRDPWLDVFPVGLYMGIAWAYVGFYVAGWLWRARAPDPDDRVIGARLRAARQQAGISLSALSDATAIPYDRLLQYEAGTRSLILADGRRIVSQPGLTTEAPFCE